MAVFVMWNRKTGVGVLQGRSVITVAIESVRACLGSADGGAGAMLVGIGSKMCGSRRIVFARFYSMM